MSNVLARQSRIDLQIVDVGIKSRVRHPMAVVCKIGPGTQNFAHDFAMTNDHLRYESSGRGGPYVLGRNTIPETDLMSTACAIENMWLPARVEGIAMGWISIYQKQDIRNILGILDSVDPVALLTIGYTSHFPDIPVLERLGWAKRLDLNGLVFQNQWDQKELDE